MPVTALLVEDAWKRFRLTSGTHSTLKGAFVRLFRGAGGEDFWALSRLSFSVAAGDSLGIVGANGSGKSTLLRLLAGILVPDRGRVLVAGRVAAMIELSAGFHPELSGRENVFLSGALHGLTRIEISRRLDAIVAFAGIERFLDTPVKLYSSGMQARLGFAVCAHLDADVLLVDEVLAVGDAAFQRRCLDWLSAFKRKGGTFVLVSHDANQVAANCARALWLDRGAPAALDTSASVVARYLSASASDVTAAVPGDRWGDGQVALADLSIVGPHGPGRLVTGRPARVRVAYTCREPEARPVFGIGIYRTDGLHVAGTNSRILGQRLPGLTGRGVAVLDLPSVPLTPGDYLLSASVSDAEVARMHDFHDRAVRFSVTDPRTAQTHGVTALAGRFRILPEAARFPPPRGGRAGRRARGVRSRAARPVRRSRHV